MEQSINSTIAKILGPDAVKQLTDQGVNLDEITKGNGEKPATFEFTLARERIGAATSALTERMGRRPSGPHAAVQIAPPSEVIDKQKHTSEVEGKGASPSSQEESVRKVTARVAPELPIIPSSVLLVRLLEDGKIEEFNKLRPAGRLDLRGVSLAKRNLSGADLRYCELGRADLSGADLTDALVQHANLDRALLEGTTLSRAKFYQAALTRCNLKNVHNAKEGQFIEADLSFSDLTQSNFDSADFTDARLGQATLDHGSFKSAILTRAILARSVLNNCIFDGALLDNARLYQARGRDISFKDAILVGAEAVDSEFTSSNQKLEGSSVKKTSFENAWIQDFEHRGSIEAELLSNAKKSGLPPEGLLPKRTEVDSGKVLIDGLAGTDKVLFDAGMAELNQLIGLKDFKAMVPELLSHIKVSLARERLGLPGFERKLHYVLVGPPGVGKTTCARIMGKLFRSLGLLKEGHVIETDKSGFIAGYAGQTLSKTNELIDDSLGGVLIADEIYALTEAKNDDYAKDAIVVLVKRLWDDRAKFSAFFLGYPKQMKEFIAANPGFDRRMAGIIEFPSNTSGELVDIFKMKMKKLAFVPSPEMLGHVSVIMAINKELKQERFGNAGTVENLVEDLSKKMSQRLDKANTLDNKLALSSCGVEDLPSEKFAKLPLSELPPLSSLTWIDGQGKEVASKDLRLSGEFPNLSERSMTAIRELILKRSLVDIETNG